MAHPVPAAADAVTSARAQAAAIASRLDALARQEMQADEQYNQAQIALAAAQARQARAAAAVAEAAQQVTAKRAVVRKVAVNSYMGSGSAGSVQVLMQSAATQLILRQGYLQQVVDTQQTAIDGLRQAEASLSQQQSQLAAASAQASHSVSSADASRQAIASTVASEQTLLNQAQGRLATLVAQAQAAQAAAAAARQRALIAARATAHAAPSVATRSQPLPARSPSGLGGGPGPAPTGGGGGGPTGGGGSANPSPAGPPPQAGGASVAVHWAQQEIGKPYVYGAAGPDSFDCSGLTMYVWGKAGVGLPHSAAGQWDDTIRVSYADLRPGDLVFYYQPVDHVGIYVGNDTMIVADHTGTNVRYASIWRDGLDGFGRVS
ncbi:MAG TPA: NlpC/P60 family protein [Acidimicrobiales bacterium]|nr:NlpC/P60 family protein [Acidimicrobiales bacterium]